MSDRSKKSWLDFLDAYRESRLLWDPKDEHRFNKELRCQAFENLLEEYYKRIDESATIEDMKSKIVNMRTSFKREVKKVQESEEKGQKYIPTLWYYDIFYSFLEEESDSPQQFNTINHFKSSMSAQRLSRSERLSFRSGLRNSGTFNGSYKDQDDEPEETQNTEPEQKKRRIYNLLQKQEKFVDRANEMLGQKEEDWEVHGKAIALQLYQLNKTQRTIAQKLISDAIFYGGLGKLQEESFINLNNRQASPEIHEQIDYLEEDLESDVDE